MAIYSTLFGTLRITNCTDWRLENVFRTEEEAKREVERRKVLTELQAGEGWGVEPKLIGRDYNQHKWQILFCDHDAADGGKFCNQLAGNPASGYCRIRHKTRSRSRNRNHRRRPPDATA